VNLTAVEWFSLLIEAGTSSKREQGRVGRLGSRTLPGHESAQHLVGRAATPSRGHGAWQDPANQRVGPVGWEAPAATGFAEMHNFQHGQPNPVSASLDTGAAWPREEGTGAPAQVTNTRR